MARGDGKVWVKVDAAGVGTKEDPKHPGNHYMPIYDAGYEQELIMEAKMKRVDNEPGAPAVAVGTNVSQENKGTPEFVPVFGTDGSVGGHFAERAPEDDIYSKIRVNKKDRSVEYSEW